MNIDPNLDLILEKQLSISPEQAWKGWTTPDLICQWFCPAPWKVIDAKVDIRPGGIFYTVMQSPEGENFPNEGCILEAIPNKKLVWTSTMKAEYRPINPNNPHDLLFTAILYFEKSSTGTKYTAIAKHASNEAKKAHEKMGFIEGWGICANQLEALMNK